MSLYDLNIPGKKIEQLNKAGIEDLEDLVSLYPVKYIDRTKLTGLLLTREESVFLFHFERISYQNSSKPLIKAFGYERTTKLPVRILWFNQSFMYNRLEGYVGYDILVAGFVSFIPAQYNEPDHYSVTNPALFDTQGLYALGIYPVYRKIPGMSAEYLQDCITIARQLIGDKPETVPKRILDSNHLISHSEMITQLHSPTSMDKLDAAIHRKRWDDLLYFALRIELNSRSCSLGSSYNLPMLRMMNEVRSNLPFQLTEDQMKVVNESIATIRSGRRLNALIQGDVGCGKTIVVMLLMIAFAENGYQAALMAPTQLLASQHYEDLKKLVDGYDLPVAFVSGQKLRKAEQKELEEKISSGHYKLIVGTQALLSNTYQFSDLALVVEDEEHKYGVMQREVLTRKAAGGTHTVTMSATPIPRSLAQTIYGDSLQLYSIRTKPVGRLPIYTGRATSLEQLFRFLVSDIRNYGHQAYVVCPMISHNEKVKGVVSAEETYELYERVLTPYGIKVALVTGKTKKQDAAQIFQEFENNNISILISTTVVEVGINVPNATCIVIRNAERFGLAQLHQLRGRVGRGKDQSFCVLESAIPENARIDAMCAHSDGFSIAEMDLRLRGAGDFLGIQQSGTERYLTMALKYPEEYTNAQTAARDILDSCEGCEILDMAIQDRQENRGGDIM